MFRWSRFAAVSLSVAAALPFAAARSRAVEATSPTYRTVAIPALPTDTLCNEEKTALIERAAAANAAAAENAQTAARYLAARQAELGRDAANSDVIVDAKAERDRRLDESRRAEAAFDAAVRVAERNCSERAEAPGIPAPPTASEPARTVENKPPTETPAPAETESTRSAAAPAPPAVQAPAPAQPAPAVQPEPVQPVQPVQQATAPVDPDRPALALAMAVSASATCRAGQNCPITVEIDNRGSQPFGSPFLAAVALGLDGGTIAAITPDAWTCGRAGEALTCAATGLSLQPDTKTRFTVDWRLPDRLRRPATTVCARVVWPARGPDGVYRAEQLAAVQFALQRAGFDPGTVDGRMGARTLDAIRAYRTKVGIQGSSEITPDLLATLFGANGALFGDANPAANSACTTVALVDARGVPVAGLPLPTQPPVASQQEPRREARTETEAEQPQVQPQPQRPRPQQAQRRPQPVRRAPPPVQADDDDTDTVTVYRTDPRVYAPSTVYGQRVIIGPPVYRPWNPFRPWW